MQKKKVLFVATVVKTHMMQFHIPYLRMFQEMGWETAVASKNDYENPADCQIPYCDTYYDIPFERLPWKPKNLKAYRMLKKISLNQIKHHLSQMLQIHQYYTLYSSFQQQHL